MNLSKAILSVILCAAPALAWTSQKGKMDVPFAFTVDGTVMQAGTYYVTTSNSNGIASIEMVSGKTVSFLARPGKLDAKTAGYAVFQPTANGYALSEVLVPGSHTVQLVPGVKPGVKSIQIAMLGR